MTFIGWAWAGRPKRDFGLPPSDGELRWLQTHTRMLLAGEGIQDITPPLGIELAGFHKPPGQERKVTGIRQPTAARALVLRAGESEIALLSLEVLGFSHEFAARVQQAVARHTGIPAGNVRLCATHTHSAPTLLPLRQWGAVSKEYEQRVEKQAVEAVTAARADLAPADCYLGKHTVTGGNHNRTAKSWRTEADFGKDATEEQRWLDTSLHALFLLREKPKRSLLWYHFSAHPVCYTDTLAGPDWPGLVATKTLARDGYQPAFLQGHCGDVNPGDGATSLGNPEHVSAAVWSALHHATSHSEHVPVEAIQTVHGSVSLPLDLDRLQEQLNTYRQDPAACSGGEWVDRGFAQDWFESAARWPKHQRNLSVPVTAVRLGSVALLFHPAELYSYYGLSIRRDSPFAHTVVCGYADGLIGYITDKTAYQRNEYAAIVVPKILDLPPFSPEAGEQLTTAIQGLLRRLESPEP